MLKNNRTHNAKFLISDSTDAQPHSGQSSTFGNICIAATWNLDWVFHHVAPCSV